MDAPAGPRASHPECFEKAPPIRVALENRLPAIPAIENVINASLKFNACFAGHDGFQLLPDLPSPTRANEICACLAPLQNESMSS